MSLRRWITSRGWHACSSYTRMTSFALMTQPCRNLSAGVTRALKGQRTSTVHPYLPVTASSDMKGPLVQGTDGFQLLSGGKNTPFPISSSEHLSANSASDKQYHCPSRILERFSNLVILDRAVPSHTFYDLPLSHDVVQPIIAPNLRVEEMVEPLTSQVGKYAKEIMRIRHKKMKKHKLKKLRKRMYFVWRKMKLIRKKKRDAIYNKELETIRATGDDFDAQGFVQEQLRKGKRGGYYINIFESKM